MAFYERNRIFPKNPILEQAVQRYKELEHRYQQIINNVKRSKASKELTDIIVELNSIRKAMKDEMKIELKRKKAPVQ